MCGDYVIIVAMVTHGVRGTISLGITVAVFLCRPVASILITGGRFPKILDAFQSLKIEVPSGCLEETSIFKIIMIDDVTLWSKLESTWSNLLY